MKRVTDYYSLGSSQSGVDFVDVDLDTDVPVYIDPAALRAQTGDWVEACIESIQTYFKALLDAIRADADHRIRALILPLQEPNETHLGLSTGESKGRSLGSEKKARELIENLRNSKAAKSGFLRDMEDTALFVRGVDRDIISDITTCIIRKHLIEYTQSECRFHGIPMEKQYSGPMWDSENEAWSDAFVELPRAGDDKLLLIPKSIVRYRLNVDKGQYFRGYLRPYFEDEELNKASSDFVDVVVDRRNRRRRRVRKTELGKHLGTTKPDIEAHTELFPQALEQYKDHLDSWPSDLLSDASVHENLGTEKEGLADILDEIAAIRPGREGANSYHRSVAKFLTLLFDTQLGNEAIEKKLHGGLKYIDITYDNVANRGFFDWLRRNYSSARVVVECKNYGKDVKNPEFDQIAMRFSPQRGEFGLLVCRDVSDLDAARARAKAIATDRHGYVILLTDDDLRTLVQEMEKGPDNLRNDYPLIRARFDELLGG